MKQRVALLALALLGACATRPPLQSESYADVIAKAQSSAMSGNFQHALDALTDYQHSFPDTPEARECDYWRGVFLLDPSNKASDSKAAVDELDRYINGEGRGSHYVEALTLRKLARQMDSLRVATATVDDDADAIKTRDDEIAKLKDELARANDELDRIKKRLASPKP